MIGHWDDDPVHRVTDWQYEVANGDTRLGYAEWAASQRYSALVERVESLERETQSGYYRPED
jgi:hypothetical protein